MADQLTIDCMENFKKWYSNRFRNATSKGFIHGDEDMLECWEAAWKASDVRWQRTFGGHVYVKSEDYTALCEKAKLTSEYRDNGD